MKVICENPTLSGNRFMNPQVTIVKEFLQRRGFSKAKDRVKDYSTNNTIYFLQLDNRNYLIVNYHPGPRRRAKEGAFDVWLSEYDRASEIGDKEAVRKEIKQQSFWVPKDIGLINEIIDGFRNKNTL
jgi:hypothetical protein